MIGGLASARGAGRLRLVGAAPARRRVAGDALAAARKRASGAIATPKKFASAQRDADYAYRLAVDPPAAKELRLFGLADWTIDRFVEPPHASARAAVRGDAAAREAAARGACCSSSAPTWSCSGRSPAPATSGALSLGETVVFAQSAVGTSMIAFGGLNWALDGAAAPVAAVLRLEAGDGRRPARSPSGSRSARPAARARDPLPRRHLRLSGRRARARALRPHHPRRLVARHRRTERRRQDDAGQAAVPAVRPAGGRHRDRRRRPARFRPRLVAVAGDRRLPGFHPLRAAAARQRRAGRRAGRRRARGARARPARRSSPSSTRCWRAATTAAPISRAASGSASRWRARCAPSSSAPASCCWTSRRRSSTSAAKRRSSTASWPPPATARRSSSRTASRPCATPTASACSNTAGSSSSARTTS